jgi:hypothetical protein
MEPGAKLALFFLLCYTPWIWYVITLLIKRIRIKRGWLRKFRRSKPIQWEDPES